jgi:hypothetical protein
LRELARARVWTFALTSAVVGIILVNALWLVHAAATVTQGMDQTVRDAAAYMTHHRETDFAVSTRLAQTFDAAEVRLPDNARVGGEGDETLMLLSDLRYNPTARVRRWPSTERGSFHTIGPLEVDFDFYSTWAGQDRVMVFTAERLRDYGVTVE